MDNKKPMSTANKPSIAVTTTIVALLVIGSVGITGFAQGMKNEFQDNVLQNSQTTARKRVLSYLDKKDQVRPVAEKVSCEGVLTDLAAYQGELIARSVNFDAPQNGKFKISLYLKNTGTSPWLSDKAGCSGKPVMRLGTAKEYDRASNFYNKEDSAWITKNRIAMKEQRVEPGEIATFTFSAKTGSEVEIYKEFFQPAVESVGWINSPATTAEIEVRVGNVSDELLYRANIMNHSDKASTFTITGEPTVYVNLTTQKTRISFGDTVVREYTVSTGHYKTPTPPGRFKILQKQDLRIGSKKPHYRMPQFQLLTPSGVGFHALPYLVNDKGTFWKEALSNIGQRVSHGCVRLLPEDAEDLFNITKVGTQVVIHY